MAMIKCPECGKEVSDKAKACPNCGYPIADASPSGTVRIKVNPLNDSTGINGNQKVSIFSSGKTLWEGNVGDVAELYFDAPTDITVKYHISLLHYGGECSGTIDPSNSKKYVVSARQGFMSTKIVLAPVDVFDAD